MSRDADHEPRPDPGREPDGDAPSGILTPTPLRTLLGWAAVGLVGGWAVHPVCERLSVVPPLVSTAQPLALLLLAAILAYVAWRTQRAVRATAATDRLTPQQAVNRLVLARASALVAALATGGYLGYALSWIGDPAELADDRLVRSLITAGCAFAATATAVLLERACRIRDEE